MFLFLTSSAVKVLDNLVSLLPKSPKEMKMAFIPTAGDVYSEKPWMEADKNKLIELGFQLKVVDVKNQTTESLENKLNGIDIIFVAGGSSTYLLQQIQKSNGLNLLREKVLSGTIYIGSSAGSILAGPNIEFDYIYNDKDDEIIKLESYNALDLVNFVVLPHANKLAYLERHQKVIDLFKNKYQFKILKDNQAILVTDNKTELIEV